MKFTLTIVIGFVLCVFAQTYLPLWWIFAPIIFILTFLAKYKTGWRSFFSGFIIAFITWLTMYLFKDAANDSVMSTKIAALFSAPNNYVLFIAASLLMGIIGGLSAVAGNSIRKKS